MTVETLRRIDRIAGSLLCCLLTLHRQWKERRVSRKNDRIQKILFIKLAEQGATVLAAETVKKAAAQVGRENVFFLVFEENRFILDILDLLPNRNIIAVSNKNAVSLAAGAVKALLRIRREKIDATIDLEFFAKSTAALSYLSGAAARAGLHSYFGEGPYRGNLMSRPVQHNPRLHASQTFEVLFDALDAPPDQLPSMESPPPPPVGQYPSFKPSENEISAMKEKLLKHGVPDNCPILIFHSNPDDMLPLRKWPEERYVDLAKRLIKKYEKIRIVFTGMDAEKTKIANLAAQVGSERCISLAGKTSLRELLTLFTLSKVLVSNDCGPAHFSSLTPIKTIALFGPETPEAFASKSPNTKTLWAELSCSPCFSAYNDRRSACKKNICLEKISVDEVESAVAEFL